ncbi:hypothetical protein KUCAC02_014622, partial [Chaenocephalus aceratus]
LFSITQDLHSSAKELYRNQMTLHIMKKQKTETHVAGLALLPATQRGSATSCLAPTTHSCFIPKLTSLSFTGQDE